MIEYLDSAPDVLAVRCVGRLDQAEIQDCLERLEAALDARPKTHVFAEVASFEGLGLDALASSLKWTGEWLRRLDRFGRVAIVADQSWIRWMAKLESAVLPHVSYETFDSNERERALAWVEGRIETPHAPAIRIIETDRDNAFAFEIDGHAGKTELDAVSRYFLKELENKTNVSVLGRIRNLGGFQMGGLFTGDYFAMKRGFLEKLDRYAVVGGPPWLRSTLNALAPLFRIEIRHFEAEDEEAAWAWIEARPVSEHTLVS